MHVGGGECIVELFTKEQKVKKSLKAALATVCLIAAGAFFMGCSSSAGDTGDAGSGYTPKYAVGDIVLNDGTKVAYSVAKDYADGSQELKDLKKNAIAVIFKADTESAPALGVGIKHSSSGLKWCKDSNVNGYNVNFTDTVVTREKNAGSLTYTGKTDGSDNFMIMARTLDNQGKNDTGLKSSNNYALPAKDESTGSDYSTLKTNYPAFEFAYYYGKNEGHNITSGSTFENGWYLPSESELNDIYQANKTENVNVIENALGVTGGDKFDDSWYWSSSQSASNNYSAYYFYFGDGDWDYNDKDGNNDFVCAVRAFN